MRSLCLTLTFLLCTVSALATGCGKAPTDKPAEVNVRSVPPEAEFEHTKPAYIDPNNP